MKVLKVLKIAVPALMLVSVSTMAGVVGSSHDLSTINAADDGQVCVYCHTPHQSLVNTFGPLWNHNTGTILTYTMYDNTTSPTFDGGASVLGSQSLACLTCHDGTTALDNISNGPGLAPWISASASMSAVGQVGVVTGTNLDLQRDHPVGFTYNTALSIADTGLNDPGVLGASISPLVTFSDKMECATCHDVHDDTINSFLRVTPTGSAICVACHAK